MLILMTNFIHKMALKCYKYQEVKLMNGKFRHAPKAHWSNNYPIVLVHGYMGYGPDQSHLMGNYFQYALKKDVLQAKNLYNTDVYIAVISPEGCLHDRACELY